MITVFEQKNVLNSLKNEYDSAITSIFEIIDLLAPNITVGIQNIKQSNAFDTIQNFINTMSSDIMLIEKNAQSVDNQHIDSDANQVFN